MLRMDASIARLYVSQYQGRSPNSRKMEDVMPWPREEAPLATLDDLHRLIGSAAAANKRKK